MPNDKRTNNQGEKLKNQSALQKSASIYAANTGPKAISKSIVSKEPEYVFRNRSIIKSVKKRRDRVIIGRKRTAHASEKLYVVKKIYGKYIVVIPNN